MAAAVFYVEKVLLVDVELLHAVVEEDVPALRGDPTSGLHSFARIIPALFGQFSFALDQDSECSEYGVPNAPEI